MMTTPPPDTSEAVRFRPSKKRKTYRQRNESTDDAHTPSDSLPTTESKTTEADESSSINVAKLRSNRRPRAGGVGFTTASRSADEATDHTLISAPSQDVAQPAVTYSTAERFTQERSAISSFDSKHMTQFIESRLSRRAEPPGSEAQPQQSTLRQAHGDSIVTTADGQKWNSARDQQPTAHGQLMEVDLAAVPLRKPPTARPQAEKKPRLGPDGKPWRGGRKRRGSDDVKRDQLVEEFLHENRLDVYDHTAENATAMEDGGNDAGTADDRLAAQFQKQYMDDMARRQLRKKPVQPPGRAAPTEDVLKGPKLGGSRNARAAVRDALLKKEKDTKK